jgi:hypothetical protein
MEILLANLTTSVAAASAMADGVALLMSTSTQQRPLVVATMESTANEV